MIVAASVTCGAIATQVKTIAIWLAGALGGLLAANLIYAELLDRLEMHDQDWYAPGERRERGAGVRYVSNTRPPLKRTKKRD